MTLHLARTRAAGSKFMNGPISKEARRKREDEIKRGRRIGRVCLMVAFVAMLPSWTFFSAGNNFDLRKVTGENVEQKNPRATNHSVALSIRNENFSVFKTDADLNTIDKNEDDSDSSRSTFDIGVDYLFWKGKNKICDLIRSMNSEEVVGRAEPLSVQQGQPRPLLNLTLRCEDLTSSMGNWITALYHARLVAAVGRVDFQFQCSTGMESAESSVLPWLSGSYPASTSQEWPYDFGWPDPGRSCTQLYAKLPLHHFAHVMQQDMRRIAAAILGPRHFDWRDDAKQHFKSLQTLLSQRPLSVQKQFFYPRPDIPLDDAAIHFRCGDIFGGTSKDVYGLVQFREYVRRIPEESTTTIGIHTQSFNTSLLRGADQAHSQDCERIVQVLVGYLQEAYPNATITVRNTRKDTIPLTYARMVMAKQTITTMSTFGVFPAIGTFGEGYVQKSGRQNKFAHRIPEVMENFHIMDGSILSSPKIKQSSWDDVVTFVTG